MDFLTTTTLIQGSIFLIGFIIIYNILAIVQSLNSDVQDLKKKVEETCFHPYQYSEPFEEMTEQIQELVPETEIIQEIQGTVQEPQETQEKPKQKKTKKAKKTVEFISEEPEIPVIFEA